MQIILLLILTLIHTNKNNKNRTQNKSLGNKQYRITSQSATDKTWYQFHKAAVTDKSNFSQIQRKTVNLRTMRKIIKENPENNCEGNKEKIK